MALNSCDIADGMLLCGYDEGGELHYVNQQSAHAVETVSGPAYTVEFAAKSDPRPAVPFHYIDGVPKGSVLVLATSPDCQLTVSPYTSIRQSLYGGLMSTRAQLLGAKGTVVLGLIRDLREHQYLNYPVFSYGLGSCAANKTTKVVAVNHPLTIAAQSPTDKTRIINPGDMIYADVNGVVAVPIHLHEEVIRRATLRSQANAKTTEDLLSGSQLQPSQKKRREEYL